MIIEQAPEVIKEQGMQKPYYLIGISAKTDESLMQKIKDLLNWLRNSEHLDQPQAGSLLSNISYTLNTGRKSL